VQTEAESVNYITHSKNTICCLNKKARTRTGTDVFILIGKHNLHGTDILSDGVNLLPFELAGNANHGLLFLAAIRTIGITVHFH